MNISSKDKIAGFPSLEVRKFVKKYQQWIEAKYVQDFFKVDETLAHEFLDKMMSEGFIKLSMFSDRWNEKLDVFEPKPTEELEFELTTKGFALVNASAAKPLRRSSVEKTLDEFLERVIALKDDNFYLYKIRKVVIFGSYLSDKERLGDIDLAIKLVLKVEDRELLRILRDKKSEYAQDQGKSFGSIISYLNWPNEEVWKFLKSRKTSIALHDFDHDTGFYLNQPHKVIYEDYSPTTDFNLDLPVP